MEEVQLNVLILEQVRADAKTEAKRQRIPLNRYVESVLKKDLKKDSMSDPFEIGSGCTQYQPDTNSTAMNCINCGMPKMSHA